MCKVKIAEVVRVRSESKPASYPWFPAQVQPLYILPKPPFVAAPAEIAYMIRISGTGTCGEADFWWR